MGDSVRKTGLKINCDKSITDDFDFSMQDADDCNMKSSRAGDHKIPKEVYIQQYHCKSPVKIGKQESKSVLTTREEHDDATLKVKPTEKKQGAN
jgi:hypothetical protein